MCAFCWIFLPILELRLWLEGFYEIGPVHLSIYLGIGSCFFPKLVTVLGVQLGW